MKLYWSPRSPFVRKVMVCAHEIGIADRLETVRSVAAMLSPNPVLMRINPLSKIPTLETDAGLVLFDSDVICEYLDTLHGGTRLHPSDPALRWPALRWRAFGSGLLDALILLRNERERPAERQLQPLVDAFNLKINAALAMLELESEALARAPFGIGQIAIGCALGYMDLRFAAMTWRGKHPALAQWHAQTSLRPSFVLTEPVDDLLRPAAGS